jgi:hypothetical protein
MIRFLCFSLALAAAGAVTAQTPRIDSLSDTGQARGGMLIVTGSNFGSEGTVVIDSLSAPVASWTDTEVVAYVPETARLAPVAVTVSTASGSSNSATLTVTDRVARGRLLWRFRMDAPYSAVRPARGLDGTIYCIDVYGRLYALAPNGALLWLVRGAGNKGLVVGPDGTIYTGSELDVKAFRTDGVLKWTFVQNPSAFILQGLAIDAEGNIYGVGTNGMGAFSLRADGTEQWRTPEPYSRPIVTYSEPVIGPSGGFDQLYWFGNQHTRAVRSDDGASVFSILAGQPVVSPLDGTIHIGSAAYSQSGQQLWNYVSGVGASVPDVGSDGRHYHVVTGSSGWNLFTLSPSGALLWNAVMPKSVSTPDIDPTNTIVVVPASSTLDIPGFVQGVSTQSHAVVWELPLPAEETQIFNPNTAQYGFNQFVDTRCKFSTDGKVAYRVSAIAPGGIVRERSFLNAIATSAGPTPPPPLAFKTRVASLTLTGSAPGPISTVTATIQIVDQSNAPVPLAAVKGTWKTPTGIFTTSATTSNTGMISWLNGYGPGVYTFTVTQVTKSGYTWDKTNSVVRRSLRM